MERSGVTRRERGSGTARPPSPLSADSTGRLPGGLSAHCFLADPTRIWPGSPQRPPSPRRAGPAGPQESRSAPRPRRGRAGRTLRSPGRRGGAAGPLGKGRFRQGRARVQELLPPGLWTDGWYHNSRCPTTRRQIRRREPTGPSDGERLGAR